MKNSTKNLMMYNSIDKIKYVNIETVNGCNYKCNICHFWKNKLTKLNFEKFKDIMDIIHTVLDEKILFIFAGGEPLLHDKICDMIKLCKQKSISPFLTTNGSLINKKLAQDLVNSGLGTIVISVDSYKKEIHEKIRGIKGSHDKVLNSLNIFSKIKEKNKDFKIGIVCTINAQNITTIPKTVDFIQKLGFIDYIELQIISQIFQTTPIPNWYKDKKYSYLWPKDKKIVINIYDELIKLKQKKGIISNSINQLKMHKDYFLEKIINQKKIICKINTAIRISTNGDIIMCGQKSPLLSSNSKSFNFKSLVSKLYSEQNLMNKCKTNCHDNINAVYN
jgi:MoaA/NifB/PqqE/SkfB family radical SAM enzyme